MKISCLIAAYRAGKYVGKALESIRAQQHSDWEVIVVEDGSRDETESIVRRFVETVSQPVRYDNLGQNRGVATARNRLLELATGDAVAFLDADDWWTPTHLTNAANAISNGGDLVVSRIQLFDLDAQRPMEVYTPPPQLFASPVSTLFELSAIMTSSCVALRRETAWAAGTFDPAFRIGEDRDFWIRCAANGARLVDSGETTCFYSKHATSTMAKTLLWAQQEVAFYEKHQTLEKISSSDRRSKLAHARLNYGRLLRAENPRESANVLRQAWRLAPLSPTIAAQWLVSTFRIAKR